MYAVTDPIVKRTQMRRQEQSLPMMKEKMPDLAKYTRSHTPTHPKQKSCMKPHNIHHAGPESSNDETEAAGSSDEEEELASPAPSCGRPHGRRRRAPKKKSRVDEVGGEWKMRTTHPLIFHKLFNFLIQKMRGIPNSYGCYGIFPASIKLKK